MDVEQSWMFEAIFNQINSPITVIKPNIPRFTIIAMNHQRKQVPGTPPDAIGRDAFDVYKSWDAASELQMTRLKDGLIEAIREKRLVKLPLLHFEFPLPDGVTIQRAWVQNEITPILDDDGKVVYLLSSARDVTAEELKRFELEEAKEKEHQLQEELAAVNEELAAANEELAATNEELLNINEELATSNEELAATNEELYSSNEQLLSTNEDLVESRRSLQDLNSELEEHVSTRTKALSESENRFRTMLETISQMTWAANNDAEGIFYNKSWYSYTGLDFEASKGYGWQVAMHPDDLAVSIAKFREMQSGVNHDGGTEIRFRRADGQYRWHLTRMLPVRSEQGDVQMWIGTATEIHELKELQQQKDDFISIASHELKTPITALKVSMQLLDRMKNNPGGEMMPKLISQSRKSVERIGALIEDLLSVSRFQQGSLQLNRSRFRLSELLNSCCNPISITGTQNIQIIGDKEIEVFADEHRIEQVVVNFINNAVKYAPSSNHIILSIQREDESVKVTVIDQGPGIPEEKLPFLFNRYYRVEPAGYQNSGLGLGLYISAEIIKQHHGEIGVESEVGKGSSFWFKIPVEG